MRPSHVPIDAELLKRLYIDERLTASQIAARVRCAEVTILRRLRRFNIPIRPRGPQINLCRPSVAWSSELAWAVGLIATDGNLSRDGRHLAIPSVDLDVLETLRSCLGLHNRISRGVKNHIYRLQWGDRPFYNRLLSIGLTPAKSLTLGPLAVPDEYFPDFVRGCIDGDGSVLVYTDRYHAAKNERYVYERLYVSLVSASRLFLDWIHARIGALVQIDGDISEQRKAGRRSLWRLRYAKAESIRLIGWMYYASNLPCLARKRAKAERLLLPLGSSSLRLTGRPRVGWLYN